MKVKPKEVLLTLPMVLMFDHAWEIGQFSSNINQIIHGKVKVKSEDLGVLGDKSVGIFYLQRNDEFAELRQEFVTLIEQEEIRLHEIELIAKKVAEEKSDNLPSGKMFVQDCGKIYETYCEHNWVLDGHNTGDTICSKCFKRE